MIISKTPLRMSFVGGGSDLPSFYREDLGAVISTAIEKHIYIAVNRKFDGRLRLSYSKTEEVDRAAELEHPLVREAMKLVGLDGGIEIASLADIPSRGSGLGSSSSFTVGLLNALYAYRSQYASRETLAAQACEIEIDRVGEPIGKQDQYAAAYGGLNLIKFHGDESVSVEPVIMQPNVYRMLDESIIAFFTGRTRSASAVLSKQNESMRVPERRALMRRMVELAFEMKKELENGNLQSFGEILDENWRLKAQISAGISDSAIDTIYKAGIENGATGGKLLGAGNGGFMIFFAPKEKHASIASALSDLKQTRFAFDKNGSQIAFFQPQDE